MKITNKISLLTVFLLAVLFLNTYVGLRQLNSVHQEFTLVAQEDIALMEALSAIREHQLEKGILLEKLIAVAEEMGFENVAFSRAEYLKDQLKNLKDGFTHYDQMINASLSKAVKIASSSSKWHEALNVLKEIESAKAQYDQRIQAMLQSVVAGGFQLSIDDLYQFQSQEKSLVKDLKELLGRVRLSVNESLNKSHQWKQKAVDVLVLTLYISTALSLLLAFWIIRRLSPSLKQIRLAAQEVGRGNFVMDLKTNTHDEIADVSHAFNTMSHRLEESTKKLEAQNKELKDVNRELDSFVHTVGHDIVEPLTGIVGYSAYLEKNYAAGLDQKGRDSLQGMKKGAARLNLLIKDLLELTRIKRVKNPFTEVAIEEVIDAALANCDYRIRQTNAEVIVHKPMPIMVCDRIKMTIIFTNLMANALKFSQKSLPRPRIEIGYRFLGPEYEFYVTDNGIGIDPLHQEEIFELFKRIPGAEEYEGSGAGLAIVKSAVESQGGRIKVQSKPGEGATFIFNIPALKK